ncbi:hypothetical protein KC340_g13036 [Hortaea werneckii]|nr:hypothetical protein KC339_g12673 [Hortaea werneckii]KAI7230283.1 hypothetical protein KC365_g7688 [Hortaea werneckii]KAI7301554.1 hypothetical protein KC340_g13036 [Hortaea werneckii]KAI7387339.1 hypothetical protein KC328_g9480 [Hortaea werneckii]
MDEKGAEQIAPSDEEEQQSTRDLVYDNADEEPELHFRTYIAIAAMFLLNLTQVFALQGPPVVLSAIGKDLNGASIQTWVPNALSLVQAILCPVIANASDVFQARKTILVGTCLLSFVGAAIAPNATHIGRVVAAQILIGFGFASVPLAYCVPSEILPRRWRPFVQAGVNLAGALGACAAPLIIGSLTERNAHTGWRLFFWIQMALWGATALGILVGYQPPKRHSGLDHLTFSQKLRHLDLPGFFLLTSGLTLFLVSLNLGGNAYAWFSAHVLSTLLIGLAILATFGVYEIKGTSTGILHHELFRGGKQRGRTFGLCVLLIFIEGILLFSFIVYYPALTTALFEQNSFLLAARIQPFWLACGIATLPYGWVSSKIRSIRSPMFVGFFVFTAGVVGMSTVQPEDSTSAVVFAGLMGLGVGAPVILVVSGVQLSVPHHLIATATALISSSRAVAATVFTAIYAAALQDRLAKLVPQQVGDAVIEAGLPATSVPAFVKAISGGMSTSDLPGVTQGIVQAGMQAYGQAQADGFRVVYIIAAPFGVVACIACFFLGDLRETMNYRVDAPVEELHGKHRQEEDRV